MLLPPRARASGRARPLRLAVCALLAACGGGEGDGGGTSPPPPPPPPRNVQAVGVAPTALALRVGEQGRLVATVTADPGVATTATWSSVDTLAVRVGGDGTVTGLRPTAGAAVCAAATADATKRACATVTVSAPVASVVVTPTMLGLVVGATQQLTAQTLDAQGAPLAGRPVAWRSGDSTRATVSASGLVTAVAPGTVTISATSEGRVGTTTVTVSAPAPAACTTARALTLGQTVSGTISANDCRLTDGSYAQLWTFTLAATTTVQLDMTSTAVDAYLFLVNAATDSLVAEDDDSGGGSNARIVRELRAGRYVVYANTFAPNSFGAYQLSLRQASSNACAADRPLGVPQTVTAALSAASCRLRDGSYADRWVIDVARRTTLQLDMTSGAMDTYLSVFDASGTLVGEDDDSGDGTNARLPLTVEAGRYLVLATTFGPNETGSYQLAATLPVDPCAATRTLSLGTPAAGALATTDCRLENGVFVQRWVLRLAAAADVRLDMTSDAFDTYLVLQRAGTGEVLGQDDDGGGGTNSRLQGALAAGEYVVNATSFLAGATGPYRLSATATGAAGNIAVTVTPATLALTPGQTLQLAAAVTGTPVTSVRWTTGNAAVATVSPTGLVRAAAVGTTTVTATSVADTTRTARATVTVTAGGGPPAGVNLDVSGLYLVQAIQTLDGRVPLIAGRPARARVWVRGSVTGIRPATVRLRVYQTGTLVATLTEIATPQTVFDEAVGSADFVVPNTLVRVGMSVLADVDPDGQIAETNEQDNAFPSSGTPMAIPVTTVPDFTLTLVPIQQPKSGLTGRPNATIVNTVGSMLPLGRTSIGVHATVTTDQPPLQGNDANGAWGELLKEIEALRRLERRPGHYFGVVQVGYTSGVTGLAYVGGLSGLGIDWATEYGSKNLTHEIGHNLSLLHAPCGTAGNQPANPDPRYPFPDGRIGNFGVDLANNFRVYTPTATDVMTYCDRDQWISVYNYTRVLTFRAQSTLAALAGDALLVSGTLTPGGVELDPAFTMAAAPADAEDANGRLEVEGLAADGRVLFRHRFEPLPLGDDRARRPFVVSVPLRAAGELASLQVRDRARPAARALRARTAGARLAADALQGPGGPAPRARPALEARRAGSTTTLRWDASAYPAAVVRNRRTGEVVAWLRSGAAELPASVDDLEVILSDGVTSASRTVSGRTGTVVP